MSESGPFGSYPWSFGRFYVFMFREIRVFGEIFDDKLYESTLVSDLIVSIFVQTKTIIIALNRLTFSAIQRVFIRGFLCYSDMYSIWMSKKCRIKNHVFCYCTLCLWIFRRTYFTNVVYVLCRFNRNLRRSSCEVTKCYCHNRCSLVRGRDWRVKDMYTSRGK